jgi:predicted amidohydrolase YtcJ
VRDHRFGVLGVGEHIYGPIHDSIGAPNHVYSQVEWDEFEKIAKVAAKRGWQINEHAQLDRTARTMMDIGEKIALEYPIVDLRWTLGHVENVTAATVERAKRLGWVITVHNHLVKPLNQPAAPVRLIQDSGIVWGMGSDGTVVATYNPFHTIWEFTSGKVYPDLVKYKPNEVLTRQEALIAHTRSNAYILFMEQDLGSLEVGKLADLVVLDRDYLEVPLDEVRKIIPIMTMIGGRVIYDRSP